MPVVMAPANNNEKNRRKARNFMCTSELPQKHFAFLNCMFLGGLKQGCWRKIRGGKGMETLHCHQPTLRPKVAPNVTNASVTSSHDGEMVPGKTLPLTCHARVTDLAAIIGKSESFGNRPPREVPSPGAPFTASARNGKVFALQGNLGPSDSVL